MAAQQLRTFSDIYSAVLEELKIQSSDTTALNRIKRDINAMYLDEVLNFKDWYWARIKADVVSEAYLSTGTASVTIDSVTVTLSSAPSESQTGKLFQVNGYAEIYRIRSHTAGSTTVTLESKYTGTTSSSASFKIWSEHIPLPVDMLETYNVWHDHDTEPMQSVGDTKFLQLRLSNPNREGRPKYFTTVDYSDPIEFETISGLPALSTRSSSGLVRTLTFASTVAAYFEEGDVIEVTSSTNSEYNGEFVVENVSTTTVKYIGLTELTEAATADASLTVKSQNSRTDSEAYRTLQVWPYLNTVDTTLHVEGIRKLKPLENDADEPAMPITDRIVLVYGACMRAWSRQRNPEEAQRNAALYERKLNNMASKIQDGTDHARLSVSGIYLAGKRGSRRTTNWESF